MITFFDSDGVDHRRSRPEVMHEPIEATAHEPIEAAAPDRIEAAAHASGIPRPPERPNAPRCIVSA